MAKLGAVQGRKAPCKGVRRGRRLRRLQKRRY